MPGLEIQACRPDFRILTESRLLTESGLQTESGILTECRLLTKSRHVADANIASTRLASAGTMPKHVSLVISLVWRLLELICLRLGCCNDNQVAQHMQAASSMFCSGIIGGLQKTATQKPSIQLELLVAGLDYMAMTQRLVSNDQPRQQHLFIYFHRYEPNKPRVAVQDEHTCCILFTLSCSSMFRFFCSA